ncbi:MAG: chemotaxis protein CheY [Myxococcales bacterium SG8_38_1]|jgi:two-component system response regulator RegA|nr:MAG: chemotaxis protein CheY [Myxococcales bacterium SG8_38_1]
MSHSEVQTNPKPSVLLVDDDARLRSRMARAFEERGYEAQQADGYDAALAIAAEESTEFAVVDLRMPGKSGLEVVRELHRVDPATKIVVLTGYGSIATALEAMRLGATHYLTKPADVDEVIASFDRDNAEPAKDLEAAEGTEPETPSLARVEWEHIQRVLTDCDGNITKAAERLGIHRRSLQRKLAKFPTRR